MIGEMFVVRPSSTFLAVAGLLLLGLQAPGQEFLGATLVDGRFEFSPPAPVDWQELAPRHLAGFEIEHPEPGFLADLVRRQDMFQNAEISFDAPLPEDLRTQVFYLVSEAGIQTIRASRLRGTVRYRLSKKGSITSRTLYGYIVAAPAEGSPQPPAGLVLARPARSDFETQKSALVSEQLVPAEVREGWDTLPAKARRFWAIETQYSFWFADEDAGYTFVKWIPDTGCHEACCEVRYSVFADELSPRLLASYSGRCDI